MIGESTKSKPTNTNLPQGDLDEFMKEFMQPKQDMNIDENDGLENLQVERPEEPQHIQMQSGAAEATGKLCVTVVDTVLPACLGVIAKDDGDNYKASDEERSELEEAFGEYMKLKGADVPPGVMVLILVGTIYGTKLPYAFQQRKIAAAKEELEKKEKELLERERELQLKLAQLEKKTDE